MFGLGWAHGRPMLPDLGAMLALPEPILALCCRMFALCWPMLALFCAMFVYVGPMFAHVGPILPNVGGFRPTRSPNKKGVSRPDVGSAAGCGGSVPSVTGNRRPPARTRARCRLPGFDLTWVGGRWLRVSNLGLPVTEGLRRDTRGSGRIIFHALQPSFSRSEPCWHRPSALIYSSHWYIPRKENAWTQLCGHRAFHKGWFWIVSTGF